MTVGEGARRYWLTPPELEKYRTGCWDPCPFPLPDGWDATKMNWEKPWYCNPPFHEYTRFVRKAIAEGDGVLVFPIPLVVAELIASGATMLEYGRYHWLDCDTLEPMKSPSPSAVWEL